MSFDDQSQRYLENGYALGLSTPSETKFLFFSLHTDVQADPLSGRGYASSLRREFILLIFRQALQRWNLLDIGPKNPAD